MKTTVKLSTSLRVSVQPCRNTGGLIVEVTHGAAFGAQSTEVIRFLPDQWGVLTEAGNQALESLGVATWEAA